MKDAMSFNMSFVNNDGKYEGGVRIQTSDGVDISSECKADSFDDLVNNVYIDILKKMLPQEKEDKEEDSQDSCNDCEYFDECWREDVDAVVDNYINKHSKDNLEEISKEQFLIDGLMEKNDLLQKQLNELQKRFDKLEEAKSYNSSLDTYADILDKYLKMLK